MFSWITRTSKRLIAISIAISAVSAFAFAQDDPDPNSPTPILLSESKSTRALATSRKINAKTDITRLSARAFSLGKKVVLYATNIDLMDGEGANAFRVYGEDKNGHQFRFPVLQIDQLTKGVSGTFAITVVLNDEIRFWDNPEQNGDILVQLTWRGMGSNRVRLGLGQIGGNVTDDPGSVPTPLGTTVAKVYKGDANTGSSPEYVGYRWSGDRMRFLEQATFGPTGALDGRIRRIGLRTWLAEQFESPYPSLANPYPNQPLKPNNAPADCDNEQTITPDVPLTCFRDTYSMYQPQTWYFREALYSDVQLRHRVAWALAQVWVTAFPDVQQGRHMVEYHKLLTNNAFGNYRTLMKQMTINPAMGNYLDMAISTRVNPNENYARELMQLFTIGLFLVNQDGTLKLDVNNNPIPTYDQNGVNNLTKLLTGWTYCQTAGASCPNVAVGTVNYIDPMIITNTANHDLTQKTLLSWPADPAFPPNNTVVNACGNCTNAANIQTYAAASMDQSLDNIFNHPNVGPFVSKILIQHLVTSNPTPAYVGRISSVFNNNGISVRGDMKAVVKAILLDPEARGDTKTDPNYGKLREPVLFTTNILRAFNVRSADGLGLSDGFITGRGEFTGMAQIPFRSPTVFNFYPPDYMIPGTTLPGPEFAIMNTGTAITRTNFVNRFVFTAIPIPVLNPDAPNGTALDFSDLQALSTADPTGNLLVDELNNRMLHGTMTAAMKATILPAVTSVLATDPLGRARQAVYLVATSSQFQVQR